ncbi:phage holin family protein [Negadavirga shengliensis]|uniref:Phage holin family protein n=1 Tax=Negadavirga shengliensis TaxID=1389218 RepID=A0ABV9T0P1_9BACT
MISISEVVTTIKKLIEIRFEILKNEIQDELGIIVARVVVLVSMVLASLFILLFCSISLAFYLGELYASPYLGFLMVAAIYLLILLILYIIRNSSVLQVNLKNSLASFVFLFKKRR